MQFYWDSLRIWPPFKMHYQARPDMGWKNCVANNKMLYDLIYIKRLCFCWNFLSSSMYYPRTCFWRLPLYIPEYSWICAGAPYVRSLEEPQILATRPAFFFAEANGSAEQLAAARGVEYVYSLHTHNLVLVLVLVAVWLIVRKITAIYIAI